MTIPAGLFDSSAIAKLLASMTGGANLPTPQGINPQAPPPPAMQQAPPPSPQMQQAFSQGLAQNPVMGDGPGLMSAPEGRQTSPGDDPNHRHRKGIRGGLMHFLGADRLDEGVASLLPVDQQQSVMARGIFGALDDATTTGGASRAQQKRALALVGMQDTKKKRDLTVEQERLWNGVVQQSEKIEDPQARLTFVAQMGSALGLPQAEMASEAVARTRAPQMQMRANAKLTVLGADNNYYAIQQDATGAEVPGSRVRVPKPTSGITYQKGVGPDGADVYYALPTEESGDARAPIAPRNTGVNAPEDPTDTRAATAAAEARANKERLLTDDLAGVNEALSQLDKNPGAFGLENVLPSVIRNRLPGAAEAATTIGSLEYVVGRLRHDRFGGALSALEADKAARIFSEPKNPPEVIRAQLEVIRKALVRQAETLRQQQGAPAASGAALRTTTRPMPPGADPAQWAAFLLSKGEKP